MIKMLCTLYPPVSPTKLQIGVSQTFTSPQMNNSSVVSYVRYKYYLQLAVVPVTFLFYAHFLLEEALILRFSHTTTNLSVTPYLISLIVQYSQRTHSRWSVVHTARSPQNIEKWGTPSMTAGCAADEQLFVNSWWVKMVSKDVRNLYYSCQSPRLQLPW